MPFFEPIRKIADTIISLNPDKIVFELVAPNKELQERILDLIRNDQLFTKGEDGEGNSLSELTQSGLGYSLFTIQEKQRKNQPTDRVTLFDTGDFYKSFGLVVTLRYMEVTADPNKEDTNLFSDFGEDIISFSELSKNKLVDIIKPLFIDFVNKKILS